MRIKALITTLFVFLMPSFPAQGGTHAETHRLPALAVSDDGHFLRTSDGHPFFYLGDTAWELFHRLTREEAEEYLQNRASKGFNVIQAVALAEFDGTDTPNAYGHRPLVERDPARPDIRDGSDNDYWDFVDFVVDRANALGMYVGLLPTWGSYWKDDGAIFNESNAETYGRFIACRYAGKGIIWILGGDRNPDNDRQKAVIRAMARGIRSSDSRNLITFHTSGWNGSSKYFHDEEWLDFNGRQNGHTPRYASYKNTLDDFNRVPTKPVVDLEPLYEDHPLDFRPDELGHSLAADVRRAIYWDVFDGACGITYGHHSVWQMYDSARGRTPINRPQMPWRKALDRPGAEQACILRRLMESRPMLGRRPAPELIVPSDVLSAVPGGDGFYRIVATLGTDGAYAMIYSPSGRTFKVRSNMLAGTRLTVWLFNPRTGKARKTASVRNDGGEITLTPPVEGEAADYVWVIDDAAKHFPASGKK